MRAEDKTSEGGTGRAGCDHEHRRKSQEAQRFVVETYHARDPSHQPFLIDPLQHAVCLVRRVFHSAGIRSERHNVITRSMQAAHPHEEFHVDPPDRSGARCTAFIMSTASSCHTRTMSTFCDCHTRDSRTTVLASKQCHVCQCSDRSPSGSCNPAVASMPDSGIVSDSTPLSLSFSQRMEQTKAEVDEVLQSTDRVPVLLPLAPSRTVTDD